MKCEKMAIPQLYIYLFPSMNNIPNLQIILLPSLSSLADLHYTNMVVMVVAARWCQWHEDMIMFMIIIIFVVVVVTVNREIGGYRQKKWENPILICLKHLLYPQQIFALTWAFLAWKVGALAIWLVMYLEIKYTLNWSDINRNRRAD